MPDHRLPRWLETVAVAVRTTLLLSTILLVSAPAATAGRDPWLVAHRRLDYPLFRPYRTLGFALSRFTYIRCYKGRSRDSLYTAYGSYGGVPRSKARGFELVEGNPQVCANPGLSTPHGTRLVGGDRAHLAVYCPATKRCSLAQGLRYGYTLWWTRDGTYVQISSERLTLPQLLDVARSLRRLHS